MFCFLELMLLDIATGLADLTVTFMANMALKITFQ